MKTIVHLSDLHLGRVDLALVAALRGVVERERPDLVVVSGDLTQRARRAQFAAARRFLDQLPSLQLVVPGNHDATSTRRRGEPNGYNVLRFEPPDRLSAAVRTWMGAAFAEAAARAWIRVADGWRPERETGA